MFRCDTKEYARDMWYQSPDNPGFSLKENCAPLKMRIGTGALRKVEASWLSPSVETRSYRVHGTVCWFAASGFKMLQ
ncbi:UNVERIFIED_CONTAM: hypothetical protein Sradi_2350900 [Sesamum radiatum]|uniref:Uncharacterized protein n=1 Tax=Sesamum radiatum TaxID=300843 RepID=A0AAW2T8P4_SESRA